MAGWPPEAEEVSDPPMHFDPDGNPISLRQWAEMRETHKRVARTMLDTCWVSTVYVGIDMGFGFGARPLIYETMVFPKDSWEEMEMARYATREEAMKGHHRMVSKYAGT